MVCGFGVVATPVCSAMANVHRPQRLGAHLATVAVANASAVDSQGRAPLDPTEHLAARWKFVENVQK